MGTYGLDGVICAWERGQLTTEQAIGQILLLLQELEERLRILERRLERYVEYVRHIGATKESRS
ncbi:MAG: hypothetical protein DRI79_09595 [Chloroflexi bacterium]|nr:MAG: hypothetical protein DRI80_13970 [Chloroflexota bacterium]RLC86749.1 MAG: hypothetical protein DRI79_09595 [Chloroflexota bacterium]HEY68528.1 hypothetical protein [Thermoflexia bacterium]